VEESKHKVRVLHLYADIEYYPPCKKYRSNGSSMLQAIKLSIDHFLEGNIDLHFSHTKTCAM